MESTAIVPNRNVTNPWWVIHRPFEADLEIMITGHDTLSWNENHSEFLEDSTQEEVIEQQVRFIPRHPENPGGKLFVDK